jgi:tetratricopeptide (TPR) repeat protein
MRLTSSSKILVISFLLLLSAQSVTAQQPKYFDNPDQLHRESVDMFNNQQYGAARQGFMDLMGLITDKNDIRYVDAAYFVAVCAIELGLGDAAIAVKHFADNYRTSRWKPRVDFLQARVLFADRKYADALEVLQKIDPAIFSADERNDFYFKRGFCKMRQNDHTGALADFSKTKSEKSPFRDASIYYYAHIQYLEGNFDDALAHFKQIENSRAFNKQIPIYIMQISYQKGDYEQIVEIGENVYNWSDNRRKPEIARILADAYYQLGHYDKALDFYLTFERMSRRQVSREDHYQIGVSRFKTEKYADAISSFQRAIGQADSLSQSAYYYLAASYQQTGQQNFARNAFLSAYKAGNDVALAEDALFNYAKLSIEGGPDPFNEAVNALQDFITNNPNSERRNEAFGYVVQLYLSSRNYDAALDFLESETLRDPSLQATYAQLAFARGMELYHAKSYKQAITYLDRAAKQRHDPAMAAKAVFWMADAYYQEKNYANARTYYRQFLSLPASRKLDIFPLAAYNIGYTYFTEKQYASALPSFRLFVKAPYKGKPEMVYDAWLRMGDCHFISKEYTQAIEAYDQVIESRVAESDYALYQKAQSYGAMGNFNRKISVLDELTRNHPRSTFYDNALYEMASTSLVMNDNRNAINYFDKLVRERPRSPWAKEALVKTGLIYYNNNQNDRAIATLKKVINDYPTTTEAREALNTLRVIYMEMNNLQEYFAYTEKLGFVQVSISEQDSLAFTMAENFYQEARCSDALRALNNYMTTYPSGAYLLQAHYYKSRCELRENRQEAALPSLLFIIDYSDNQYTDEALLDAARILYDKGEYAQANTYYSRLYELTDDPLRQLESLEGKMKSSYFLQQYDEAITSARNLKSNPQRGQEQLLQAHYIMGKSLFGQKQYREARIELDAAHKMSFGVLGAEAYYLMSVIDYENGYHNEAQDQLFDLADKYSAHDYWVAKGFLLLADIYVKLDNNFQARQTLQSIIDNYRGDDLRQIAAQKLEAIKE